MSRNYTFLHGRRLFSFLVFSLAIALVLFHFHGLVRDAVSVVNGRLKTVDAHASPAALVNNYSIAVKQGVLQADAPAMPDISRFTVENIAALAPPFTPGKVALTGMGGYPGMREFIKKDGRIQRLRLSQMAV